ncbi:MBOAT family protein [Cytobacillus spongiae]|uniref:MBOAT family O-acyltransferase n=1 Tax=Cytobacillus spongiae TaxID=2901381 RepID=UPI001F198D18|nr:MBOAT family protein [Cytobacillus spongiae]UII55637.1 MBOAT family protein [Cytobacillus spongiae]
MIFNSFEFIFVFLPIVFVVYFLLNKVNFTISKIWLLLSSLFFYSWWNPKYLPLILVSLGINYLIGTYLGKENPTYRRKFWLTVGIVFNVCLLGYFKYYDFFISNLNVVLGANLQVLHLILPLAISFYTFQQIGYLVDSFRNETKNYNFLNYSLFVSFFPQLIAGPIVHHSAVMSQFSDRQNRKINYKNIGLGLFIFAVGLFKKVGIADTFSVWANKGYSMSENLTFVDSWATSLSYTFQLYFDFSGYSDMAIGAGLLFNIVLPMNFNSPYKALNIQDFWRRWHITLSSFLTKYIYIPLGGNRKGRFRTYLNILIIFFISGFWHGAGWTFIVWGVLHGLASVINRLWSKAGFKMYKWLAWLITFQFVNATWVFFRAPSFEIAQNVLKGMVGLNGFGLPEEFNHFEYLQGKVSNFYAFPLDDGFIKPAIVILLGLIVTLFAKNSIELKNNLKPNWTNAFFVSALIVYSVFQLQKVTEFLYFNF